MRLGDLRNRNSVGKDEVTGEMVKDRVRRWWNRSGGCAVWALRLVYFLMTGDML